MLEELERVRAYRADVPEPDEATVAAARAELMEAIGQEPRRASPAPRSRAARGRGSDYASCSGVGGSCWPAGWPRSASASPECSA